MQIPQPALLRLRHRSTIKKKPITRKSDEIPWQRAHDGAQLITECRFTFRLHNFGDFRCNRFGSHRPSPFLTQPQNPFTLWEITSYVANLQQSTMCFYIHTKSLHKQKAEIKSTQSISANHGSGEIHLEPTSSIICTTSTEFSLSLRHKFETQWVFSPEEVWVIVSFWTIHEYLLLFYEMKTEWITWLYKMLFLPINLPLELIVFLHWWPWSLLSLTCHLRKTLLCLGRLRFSVTFTKIDLPSTHFRHCDFLFLKSVFRGKLLFLSCV